MKKTLILLFFLFAGIPLLMAQTSVIVGTSTTNSDKAPFGVFYSYERSASLYKASEIGTTGTITAIKWQLATGSSTIIPTKIYLKITGDTVLTDTTWSAMISGATQVYNSNAQFNQPPSFYMFNSISAYTYTGGNLLILVETNYGGTGTSNTPLFNYTQSNSRHQIWQDNNIVLINTVEGLVNNERPNVMLTFAPKPNDAGITAITSPVTPSSSGSWPISITLKNYGTNFLTSVDISWNVNSGPVTTYSWTGSLPQNASQTGIVIGTHAFPNGIHTIKTWTSMPNASVDDHPMNDTLRIQADICSPLSGTYFIGGATANFPTLVAAVNSLVTCGIQGPVTFNINPGTYTGSVIIPAITGSSATNTITIQSSVNDSTSVTLNPVPATNYTIQLDGVDHITIKHLTIAAGINSPAIYTLNGLKHVHIKNNRLIGPINGSSAFASTLLVDQGGGDSLNVFSNNDIANGVYGIRMLGGGHNSTISNNYIHDFNDYGIYVIGSSFPLINNNRLTSSVSAVWKTGIAMINCNADFELSGNKVYVSGGTSTLNGIYINDCGGMSSNKALIANNFVSQPGGNSLHIRYPRYIDVYHNSLHVYGIIPMVSSTTLYLYNTTGTYTGNAFRNNIIANSAGEMAIHMDGTATSISASDYNDIYTSGSVLAQRFSFTQLTLADWQYANPGFDLNSVSLNPAFTSNNDLHILNWSLYNTGTPVPEVTDDIDQQSRNTVSPDIGADEFAWPSDDAGITGLDVPSQPFPTGISPVKVTIRNFGLNPLTNCTINWTPDGINIYSYNWTGNLPQFTSEDSILVGTHNFSTLDNPITAWTSNPNGVVDGHMLNDTLITSVCTMLNGSYTIGGPGADFASFTAAAQKLQSCGVSGPVLFNVSPGTYTESVLIPQIAGASATNNIVFTSAGNDSTSVTLTAVGLSAPYALRLNGADHITISHMTVINDAGSVIELVYGAHHNKIVSNIVDAVNISVNYSGIASGINTVDSCNIVRFNEVINGARGISFSGYGFSQVDTLERGNIIENNYVHGYSAFGIHAQFQHAIKISSNKLVSSMTPIALKINYCRGTASEHSLVSNNFVSQDGLYTLLGIEVISCTYSDFFNNSINIAGGNSSSSAFYIQSGSNSNNINILNNVFVNTGGGYSINIYDNNPTSFITSCDYNNFYVTGATIGQYSSNTYSNLAAWKNATPFDDNTLSLDPQFSSYTDLHINNTGLVDAGNPITFSAVPGDIDGEARAGMPDIGADEYSVITELNEQESKESTISISPNPFYDEVIFSFREACDAEVRIIDASGRLVFLVAEEKASQVRIPRNSFSSGIYFYQIWINSAFVSSGKLVVSE